MTSENTNDGFIKAVRPPYLLIAIMVVCFGTVLLLILLMIGLPRNRHPEWAPGGCSVYRDYQNFRIILIVNETENFDTEPEVATVILDTLRNNAFFFGGGETGVVPGLARNQIQIQYPGPHGANPILRYYKAIRYNGQTLRETIEVDGVPEDVRFDDMSIENLRKMKNCTLTLGILDQLEFGNAEDND